MQNETPEARPATAATDRVIWRKDLRKLCGDVCGETIRLWIKSGKLPPPDFKLTLKTMGWKVSTLRAAGFPVSVESDPARQRGPA